MSISNEKWLEISLKRVKAAYDACGEDGAKKLIKDIYDSDSSAYRNLDGILHGLRSLLKSSVSSLEEAKKMYQEGSVVNAYLEWAWEESEESMDDIVRHMQDFGGGLLDYALRKDDEEYEKLLKLAKENLPESELRDSYEQELFLKTWFNVESPNEVDVEKVREQIKRLPRLQTQEVSDFVKCIDAYFPEFENKLRDDYERIGKGCIERGSWASAYSVYQHIGAAGIVNAIEAISVSRKGRGLKIPKVKIPKNYRELRRDVWYRLGVEFGNGGKAKNALKCFGRSLKIQRSISDKPTKELIKVMHGTAKAQLDVAEKYFEGEYKLPLHHLYAVQLPVPKGCLPLPEAPKKELTSRKYEKAIKRYNKILEIHPDDIDALLYVSYAYARCGACLADYKDWKSKHMLNDAKEKLKEAMKMEDKFSKEQSKRADGLRDVLDTGLTFRKFLGI